MKPLLLTILTIFILGCSHTLKDQVKHEDCYKLLVTEVGFVYVGMPKEDLERTGYTDLIQENYRKVANQEWITFSNWIAKESGDKVTFYIVDGKIKGWKGE